MPAEHSDRFQRLRDILYVAPRPQTWLIEGLKGAGWNPIHARDPSGVRETCRGGSLAVGLVEIGEADGEEIALPDLVAAAGPQVQWIALGSRELLERADLKSAISRYCYDFATMPVPMERLAVTLGRAYGMVGLRRTLSSENEDAQDGHGFVGTSEAIDAVRRALASFATTDAPVLILGETGTGKHLAAATIHALSGRRQGPLVSTSCSLLPASLMESELFGYERGAFLRPEHQQIGKLESANHGTLFLDDVGDLPAQVQVSLLRFLETRHIQRDGGEVELDLRVIAASSVDLDSAVREGRFRQDLLYRLNMLTLRLPPLRDRVDDIELLAYQALKTHSSERPSRLRGFSQDALKAMRLYAWPGNVRELINRVRRALILAQGPWIGASDLGLSGLPDGGESLSDVRRQAEVAAVRQTFQRTGGNVSEAARRLHVTRSTLYRLIRKYGLDPLSWEGAPEARGRGRPPASRSGDPAAHSAPPPRAPTRPASAA